MRSVESPSTRRSQATAPTSLRGPEPRRRALEREGVCRHRPAAGARPLVNGVGIDPIRISDLAPRVASFLACGHSHVVHFIPADPTVVARDSTDYRRILNRGDLNLPDGLPVAWVLRRLGCETDRIAGTDGFRLLCDWGCRRGVRHFLYGGSPSVLRDLQLRLERDFLGIAIAGAISPPFRPLSDDELERDAAEIRDSGADLVWIGLGTPKQDLVAERLRALHAAPVILCVGAAFDFVAGEKRRAPRWMQQTGLEWLFRLGSEPRRLWRRYLIGNPRFVLGVAGDAIRGEGRGQVGSR